MQSRELRTIDVSEDGRDDVLLLCEALANMAAEMITFDPREPLLSELVDIAKRVIARYEQQPIEPSYH
jgi:hypothetical protein